MFREFYLILLKFFQWKYLSNPSCSPRPFMVFILFSPSFIRKAEYNTNKMINTILYRQCLLTQDMNRREQNKQICKYVDCLALSVSLFLIISLSSSFFLSVILSCLYILFCSLYLSLVINCPLSSCFLTCLSLSS